MGISKVAEENKCSESLMYPIFCKANPSKFSDLNQHFYFAHYSVGQQIRSGYLDVFSGLGQTLSSPGVWLQCSS